MGQARERERERAREEERGRARERDRLGKRCAGLHGAIVQTVRVKYGLSAPYFKIKRLLEAPKIPLELQLYTTLQKKNHQLTNTALSNGLI